MAHQRRSAQWDLFAPPKPATALGRELARQLLPLLEQLLREVIVTEASAAEGSDEQDHA